MSGDNSMDVDVPELLPSPMPASLPPLPQAEMNEFQKQMTNFSKREHWSSRLIAAGSDKGGLQDVLFSVLTSYGRIMSSQTALQKNLIDLPTYEDIDALVESLTDDEVEEWKNLVQIGDWVGLINHSKLRKSDADPEQTENTGYTSERLGKAYTRTFIGDFATKFIKHLEQANIGQETNEQPPLYAKAISVVQSSGTGKSRMLTEVGKQIFTLPICLRRSGEPGYPPGDKPVVDFFSGLRRNNDLSLTAHAAIASFLAAAHEMMLETLQKAHNAGLSGQALLNHWYRLMEAVEGRKSREEFFTKVVERANAIRLKVVIDQKSPIRGDKGKEPANVNPFEMSRDYYKLNAKEATGKLMEFLSRVLPGKISVMYIDEAHELGPHLCQIFLRLVQHQPRLTRMWYTLMGTKSSISYYAPPRRKMISFRLKEEVARLPTPYIDVGFDQRAIAKSRAVSVRMGDMETIEFLSQYGRPICSAQLPEESEGEMINFASFKLRNGEKFRATDKDHVFAVLSQRLCLDPAMAASEAIDLADRSVAHHMRLLTGFSPHSDVFYTHSPSEPVLVMGSIDILYNTPEPARRLQEVLNTLSQELCAAGLIEKGILGELGACTLLLIARDFAAPLHSSRNGRNLLKPVPLMHFLDTLFGKDIFDPSDRQKFEKAFGNAHVNFTHWISTRDSLPEANEQLLANLWARGAGLQCCFSRESIDLLLVVYHGSIDADSIFDPSLLSSIAAQIKFRTAADGNAELAIRPIGVVRDLDKPLPYLAILMELGCEQRFKGNGEKIKYLAAGPLADGAFRTLHTAWDAAAKDLKTNTKKNAAQGLKKKVSDARLAVDSYNRYSISVRGTSPDVYGILRTAKITKEFATLLSIITSSIAEDHGTKKHMRPLERLSDRSHIAWMSDYGLSNEGWRWSPNT